MNSSGSPRLEARSLECVRGDRLLFRGLGLALRAGELAQVSGANGSGKTSLLRILGGLNRLESGTIFWDGDDISELGPDFLLHMQYLGHHDGIKLDLSPRENLEFASCLGPTRDSVSVGAALESAGIGAQSDVPARSLSAGQRRRVALARLLLMQAELWLLDEPYTALDEDGRRIFGKALADHAAAGGVAVIATHDALPDVSVTTRVSL